MLLSDIKYLLNFAFRDLQATQNSWRSPRIRERMNPGKLKFQKYSNSGGKLNFRDDVTNYACAFATAVYLVTAESGQPLHPGEPPESEGRRTNEGVRF